MAAEQTVQDLMANLAESIEEARAERDRPRREWLEWRRGGIGASDVAGILGLSRWASPFSLWCEKTGAVPLDDTDSDYAKFGRYAERMIAPWFTDETGLYVVGEQARIEHADQPWRRCTTDGFVTDKADAAYIDLDELLGLCQIKTTGPGRRYDEVPADWQAQEQWEMHVTGLPKAWLAVLHGRRLEVYELERDDEDIAFIVEQVDAFWHDHVLTGVPPEVDGHEATLAAIEVLYPRAVPKSTRAIDDVAGALDMLRDAARARKAAGANENAAKAVLRWALGDTYEGTVDGERALTCGSQTRKTTCAGCGHVEESAPFRVLRPTGRWKP